MDSSRVTVAKALTLWGNGEYPFDQARRTMGAAPVAAAEAGMQDFLREYSPANQYWKPIASAPKDGSCFLVERDVPSENSMCVAFWHVGQNVPGFVATGTGFEIDTNIYNIWRPLPRPALTPQQRRLAKEHDAR